MIHAKRYARIPLPYPNDRMTQINLTRVGSMLRYLPIPAQTPAIILPDEGRTILFAKPTHLFPPIQQIAQRDIAHRKLP